MCFLKWDINLPSLERPYIPTDWVVTIEKKSYYGHPFEQKHFEIFKRIVAITAIAIGTLLIIPIIILAPTRMYTRAFKWIIEIKETCSLYAKVKEIGSTKIFTSEKIAPAPVKSDAPSEFRKILATNRDPLPAINDVIAFKDYVKMEYRPKTIIQQNLLSLIDKYPRLNDSTLFKIRGDGDCAFRAMSIAMRLHSLSHPEISIHQQVQKAHQFFRNVNDPRLANLKEAFNQAVKKVREKLEFSPALVSGCFDQELDQEMIGFLRLSSALYLLTQPNLPEAVANVLLIQSNEFGKDQETYLIAKGMSRQPNTAPLFGNWGDMYAVSKLFGLPMSWLLVEEKYLISQNFAFDREVPSVSPYILLNVPGHVNLITLR